MLREFTKTLFGRMTQSCDLFLSLAAWTTRLSVGSDGSHAFCPLRGTSESSDLAVTMLDAFSLCRASSNLFGPKKNNCEVHELSRIHACTDQLPDQPFVASLAFFHDAVTGTAPFVSSIGDLAG